MNSRDRVLAALSLEQPDKVPFVESRVDLPIQRLLLGIDEPPHRKSDIETGQDLLYIDGLNDVMGMDNIQVRFLPPVFAKFHTINGNLYPVEPFVRSRDDLDKLVFPDPDDPKMYKNAKRVIRRYKGKYAIGASLRTGIAATYMSMGLDGFSYLLLDDPGLINSVLGRYADWTISIVKNLKEVGVDFIWTFDDLAMKTGPLFSPIVFRDTLMPHMLRVGDAIKSYGFPWVLHSDGNILPLMDDLISMGISGFHPIEPSAMDIKEMKELYGDRICLIGNIDLHYTLTRGTVEEVEDEVKNCIENIGKGGGYMISSANSITSYCKIKNIQAMIRAIQKFRAY